MWPFKSGAMRPRLDKDGLRAQIVDGLQSSIHREKSILHRRLNFQEPNEERPTVRLHSRRTGRIYKIFQALSSSEDEG